MCGIAGEVRFDGRPPDNGLVTRMAWTLKHRGPDGSGQWSDSHAAIAHRRLAIRDLSPAGAQPILSANGEVVVSFNGEIYNDVELRSELIGKYGVRFQSNCDAEVIPAGYIAWGEAIFNRLEGMFAIALWDVRRQLLYLVRDGVGIKPLFYHWQNGRLLFGSEIKAITAGLGHPTTLDPVGLHAFLAQGFVGPESTLIPGVRQVPPGSWKCFSADGTTNQRFWSPRRTGDLEDSEEAHSRFAGLFRRVCRDMLVSDVPVGVLQSGGVDSSLVSLTLNDPATPLFTAGFNQNDFSDFDETALAKKVAGLTGAPWRSIGADDTADIEEDVRRVIWHFDGHLADSSGLAFYRLTREVRRHVTVALGGDGADEFFAGYSTYCASQLAARFGMLVPKRLTGCVAKLAFAAGSKSRERYSKLQIFGRFILGLQSGRSAHAEWRRYAMPWDCDQLYAGEMRELLSLDPLAEYKLALKGGSIIDSCLRADQTHYLPADMLMKVDAMSMAHGLEIRVPFLDRRIMDFAGMLAPTLLGGDCCSSTKKFLRDALARCGGPEEIYRGKKTGFNVPVSALLRNALRPMANRLFDEQPDVFAPYFRPDMVRKVWRSHREGQADYSYLLWTLMTLGVWWRQMALA